MIIPDLNLLLYAYDVGSPFHAKSKAWWEHCLSGEEPVGIPTLVAFGFVRLGTHARVFRQPMTPGEAARHVRSWLAQPVARILEPGDGHLERVLALLETLETAGNLVTDAQLAALARIFHTFSSRDAARGRLARRPK